MSTIQILPPSHCFVHYKPLDMYTFRIYGRCHSVFKALLATFLLISSTNLFSQEKRPNKTKIVALPIGFYTPDTKIGGGVGGLLTFNFRQDTLGARRSSVTIGAVYTQLNQVLLYFPFQLFPKNQSYWLNGELGYYRYVFNYFGMGNTIPNDYIEKYTAVFPRVRLNLAKKIAPGLFLGIRYTFDDKSITRRDSFGFLERDRPEGWQGGRVSGAGLGLNYDTRDQIFYPNRGYLIESQLYTEGGYTGSDFRYDRFAVDAARYWPLKHKSVLALNAAVTLTRGTVPFHQMPNLGGPRRLRGYYEGKYRDRHLVLVQSEYRFPIYKRFSGTAFGGLGWVAPTLSAFALKYTRWHSGAGLRFVLDKAQRINIRADYGFGAGSSGFYLTVGEAF